MLILTKRKDYKIIVLLRMDQSYSTVGRKLNIYYKASVNMPVNGFTYIIKKRERMDKNRKYVRENKIHRQANQVKR